MIAFVNGEFVDDGAAAVSIHDRGFLFGDGVFETGLLHEGGFFRLRQHLERFAASAAMLRLEAPAFDDVESIVRRLARENALRSGNLRITLTRGVHEPGLIVSLQPADPARLERARRGWTLVTARTRRPSAAAVPPQLKALGRTYALLARVEAADAGADDALLLTDDGLVCEGPSWNLFWRRAGTLFTPALDVGVLAGVTRAVLIDLARSRGFDVVEDAFPRDRLDDADEVFATMTSVGIAPIRSLDGRPLPAETPAADSLLPLYWRLVSDETAADRLRHQPSG